MSRLKFFTTLAMAVGTLLVAKGLFGALVNVPLIGDVRYAEINLGGKALTITILILLAISVVFISFSDRRNRLAWLFGGLGLGLSVASLLDIYRGTMDKLQELADATGGQDVKELLAKTQTQSGTYLVAIGFLFFAGGIIATLFERQRERWL